MNASSKKSATTAAELPGAPHLLAQLDALRRQVRDLSARLEDSARDYDTRQRRWQAQRDEAFAAEQQRVASEQQNARTEAAARRAQLEAHFAARRQRIQKAHDNARTTRLAQLDAAEGKHTFDIQRAQLDADRRRDEQNQENKRRLEAFNTRFTQVQGAWQQFHLRARTALWPYRQLASALDAEPLPHALDPAQSPERMLDEVESRLADAAQQLRRYQLTLLPVFFRWLPRAFLVPLVLVAAFLLVPELRRFDLAGVSPKTWVALAIAVAGIFLLHFFGARLAASPARRLAEVLRQAHGLLETAARAAEERFAREAERIALDHAQAIHQLNQQWKQVQAQARRQRLELEERLAEQTRKLQTVNDARRAQALGRLEHELADRLARLDADATARRAQLEKSFAEAREQIETARQNALRAAQTDWRERIVPLWDELRRLHDRAAALFPPWRPECWETVRLPESFTHAAPLGQFSVALETFLGTRPPQFESELASSSGSPALTGTLQLPMLLTIPDAANLLLETRQSGRETAVAVLNNLVLRLLTSAPPGRLAFTILDPVGLGQSFAGLMHLADFEERIINSRIWTQPQQIEQRLGELSEHVEKVTQMYLRNEFATLAEYNARAGRLAEKYHFLIVADFPVNFTDLAVKRLQSLAASGPRCGVYVLVHWDQRRTAPPEFVPDELRKHALRLLAKPAGGFAVANADWDGTRLELEAPPDPALATRLLTAIGQAGRDAYRVETPFAEAAPADNQMWSLDATHELRVPIGRTGATRLQYLALGQDTRQHGLIAGKTGSGKSTLFHVIITNLALWYPPDEVELYLVDFKKGVEFKCYATHQLPHARVIAIESDREFGLSVLQRVDEELKRRGDLFRQRGVQDLPGYRRASGGEPLPRVLLLIDEFQEFFVEDDRIAQSAALLLDRIVRQGRAFGIHVLLGSQTLGGAYTLARATMGQMVVRIALQCNEADASLILNEDNLAPRLLSRPGEAIYNDESGAVAGNSPFQVVWLPETERDEWLARVRARAEAQRSAPLPEPIVFEGNAPADVRANAQLRALLESPPHPAPSQARVFLGAPNSIKGPTEVVFRRQSGSHLLIVGQREETALSLLSIALVTLAAQFPPNAARFRVFTAAAPDSPEARLLTAAIHAAGGDAQLVRPGEVEAVLSALDAELRQRTEPGAAPGPETFLFVHDLHRHPKLRFDEEMSFSLDAEAGAHPGLQLHRLITEGGPHGFHVLASCDSYNSLLRMLSRKALSEFELRVLFQMSANDSASLMDSPLANQLGLYRAALFNSREGWIEIFRPYAPPDSAWWEEVAGRLARRTAAA
ncbi:MAG: FtsK/SpoIIIE domain-containing protein [Verrucomicrobiae bacterium]|nr:FtsK/SpoIIIE domain-containing protein [Verrucomicrobiae bacterium]